MTKEQKKELWKFYKKPENGCLIYTIIKKRLFKLKNIKEEVNDNELNILYWRYLNSIKHPPYSKKKFYKKLFE